MDATDRQVLAILSGDASAAPLFAAIRRRRSVVILAAAVGAAMLAIALHDDLPERRSQAVSVTQVSTPPPVRRQAKPEPVVTPSAGGRAEPLPEAAQRVTVAAVRGAGMAALPRRRLSRRRTLKGAPIKADRVPALKVDPEHASPVDLAKQIRDEQLEAMDAIRQLRQR